MTDSGDNLTYNVVCASLGENITHETAIDDGGANAYTPLTPLVNDVVQVQGVSPEMDNSAVFDLEDNYFYQVGANIQYPEVVQVQGVSISVDSEIGLTDEEEFISEYTQLGAAGEYFVNIDPNYLIRINPDGNPKIKAATAGWSTTDGWDSDTELDFSDLRYDADNNPRVTINYFDVIEQTNIESIEVETIDSGVFTIRNKRRDE